MRAKSPMERKCLKSCLQWAKKVNWNCIKRSNKPAECAKNS